jgi:hypothetical protein
MKFAERRYRRHNGQQQLAIERNMKAQSLRVFILGVTLSPLLLCVGCEEDLANADVIPPNSDLPVLGVAADEKKVEAPAEAPTPADPQAKPAGDEPAKTRPPTVVQNAVPPQSLKLSPALEEITKMIQAGVSDDVLMVYIVNSTNLFNVGADEIVYLNDLGVSSQITTTLIQHDATPEIMALKKAATAATPLPPGIALTQPANNIYPSTTPPPPPPAPPESSSLPASTPPPAASAADYGPQQVANGSTFYDELAPYGNWIQLEGYGLCWQPTIAVYNSYWRPYCDNGRWLWTDAGWYWHSGYSWGWAPFHYGRWCTYPSVGWVWQPDTCWGPSWVTWRYTPYYCGWAPLPPSCQYVSGFGLYYQNGSVGLSFGFGFGADCYTFIPLNRFCDRSPHHYYTTLDHTRALYKDSTVVNNYVVGNNNTIINEGIGRERVARVTRSDIPKVSIRTTPLAKDPTQRGERLERNGTELTLVRPTLPKDPPKSISTVPAPRSQAEVRKDGRITEPFRPSVTPASRPENAKAPASSSVVKPTPPTPGLPVGTDPTVARKNAAESAKPVRPNSIVITRANVNDFANVRVPSSTTSLGAGTQRPAAPATPTSTLPPTERSVINPTTRAPGSTAAAPGSSPSGVTRTPVRPSAPVPTSQRSAVAAPSGNRPDTWRVYSEPQATPSRPVAPATDATRNPFLGGSGSSAPARPAYVAPNGASMAPAWSGGAAAAPTSRSYSEPARPTTSAPRQTYYAPSQAAPASRPTTAAPRSSGGGGSARSGQANAGK